MCPVEVGGLPRKRFGSETDVGAGKSRFSEAGLLMELLTRQPSQNPLGRSRSLRRSRASPSGSRSPTGPRDLSALQGMATLDPQVPAGSPSAAGPSARPLSQHPLQYVIIY